jgi:hypothetical protein
MKKNLRELIISEIKVTGELYDWSFKRGDNNARAFKTYEEYLVSLNDYDLLATYRLVVQAEESNDD